MEGFEPSTFKATICYSSTELHLLVIKEINLKFDNKKNQKKLMDLNKKKDLYT